MQLMTCQISQYLGVMSARKLVIPLAGALAGILVPVIMLLFFLVSGCHPEPAPATIKPAALDPSTVALSS